MVRSRQTLRIPSALCIVFKYLVGSLWVNWESVVSINFAVHVRVVVGRRSVNEYVDDECRDHVGEG